MTTTSDLLELVRAPAALTVLGDTAVGAQAAAGGFRGRGWLLPLASVAIYSGGMALNDWADRGVDAAERPERPIPSGRISPRRALAVAAGLGAIGLALAAAGGGRRGLAVAVPLAASVVAYDVVAKPTAAGPLAMAACRGLDVLMGAGGSPRALPAALAIAVHTLGVTALSRGEVHGGTGADAGIALVATGAAAAAVDAAAGSAPAAQAQAPASRIGGALGSAAYLAAALPGQLAALEEPSPTKVRDATRAGIGSVVPLQAALVARAGGIAVATGLMAVHATIRMRARRGRRGEIT
ncbi:4-hydroxybenzoate polyprenyltransferase [Agromyces sp. CF514]|uniref:SCO3242 family prenyltransferase n=1 Tax=Agromyces sp. CF514 TaxID=1881031 RepID=UPI0008EBA1F8|nr:UbiA family prenyltransferase [Agromyces sp. CF514]SFR91324.1 4-hydroxybenzoate polyprenyltransferase [Agromyces sp. CF514]